MAKIIDRAIAEDGSEYVLFRSSNEYIIRVNGYELMTSNCYGSEEKLALSTFTSISSTKKPLVLVGGLGMGFTLRALLTLLPAESEVYVSEIESSVINWNKEVFKDINGDVLSDPRVCLHNVDVASRLTGRNTYDAIILDIDNGPRPLSSAGNVWLYSEEGIASIYESLKNGGVFTLWSAFVDQEFLKRVEDAKFEVTIEHTFSHKDRSAGEYIIYKCLK